MVLHYRLPWYTFAAVTRWLSIYNYDAKIINCSKINGLVRRKAGGVIKSKGKFVIIILYFSRYT